MSRGDTMPDIGSLLDVVDEYDETAEIVAAAVAKERAAVVAWLREPGEYVDPACSRLADCIERGEHRREETS